MTSFVIADRSFVSEALRSARKALPDAVRRLLRGPVETVAIADIEGSGRRRPFRRVDLVVPPDMILRRRIVVPAKARQDVTRAIELFLRSETPFASDEVLVHALEEVARPSDQQLAYTVRLLPRSALQRALEVLKLRIRQIDRVVLDGAPDVDFAPALLPGQRFTRWLPVVPLTVIVVSVALTGFSDLSLRQARITELESEVAATLGRVRALVSGVETARKQASGTAVVLKLLNDTPSAFVTLQTIRRFLPAGTEVLRVDLRAAEARLAVRSPNALDDAQRLSAEATPWAGSIEGPITADSGSNLEIATILLRPRVTDPT